MRKITNYIALFTFAIAPLLSFGFVSAQTYQQNFPLYQTIDSGQTLTIVSWESPNNTHLYKHGYRSWNEVSVDLPYSGDYQVKTRYYANGPETQTMEEYRLKVDGITLGQTTDCGTDCYETEDMGSHYFSSGSHLVRVEHIAHWEDENTANSIEPFWVSFDYLAPPPTVDLKANGSDAPSNNPLILCYRDYLTLSWTSSNANSCIASGDWSGTKATGGSESVQLNSVRTFIFTITCQGAQGTNPATDSVYVRINPSSPVVITLGATLTL